MLVFLDMSRFSAVPRRHFRRIATSVIVTSAVLAYLTVGMAGASPHPIGDEFYVGPTLTTETRPGVLLRHEPTAVAAAALPTALPYERILYTSTKSDDSIAASSGSLFSSNAPWTSPTPRPIVALAPGTQGQGDQCAPSKTMAEPFNANAPTGLFQVEIPLIVNFLSRGFDVVMTDYTGLGTAGVHTYVNRVDQGTAVLDSVRAALSLRPSADRSTPVGLWGYSQGGGAVASAAELASSYAPELTIAGTYAGAVPADLARTLDRIDGSILSGAIGYALNGFRESNPELGPIIDAQTNDVGKEMLADVAEQCTVRTALTYGLKSTGNYTVSGRPLSELLSSIPEAQTVLEENRIGTRAPSGPVLLHSVRTDDIVDYGQVADLAGQWCRAGGTVRFESQDAPSIVEGSGISHLGPSQLVFPQYSQWLSDRLSGVVGGGPFCA
ncbi:lipase family protein [Rhodococcus sp. I2R]|uniref:lipase family protein n=1 Tax=Rhodococcus sp. I2R TaxID=2855445 RepID=UPI001E53C4B3|nr:lipase family protein [Rhodococcus sp. I2R]MCC8929802.1 lipase family protein [Rhodococcus sp. I2R]